LHFSDAQPLSVSKGDAIVIPYSAGELSVTNCAGIISRPPKP
jgi:mannose-6-phosphate isomerase